MVTPIKAVQAATPTPADLLTFVMNDRGLQAYAQPVIGANAALNADTKVHVARGADGFALGAKPGMLQDKGVATHIGNSIYSILHGQHTPPLTAQQTQLYQASLTALGYTNDGKGHIAVNVADPNKAIQDPGVRSVLVADRYSTVLKHNGYVTHDQHGWAPVAGKTAPKPADLDILERKDRAAHAAPTAPVAPAAGAPPAADTTHTGAPPAKVHKAHKHPKGTPPTQPAAGGQGGNGQGGVQPPKPPVGGPSSTFSPY